MQNQVFVLVLVFVSVLELELALELVVLSTRCVSRPLLSCIYMFARNNRVSTWSQGVCVCVSLFLFRCGTSVWVEANRAGGLISISRRLNFNLELFCYSMSCVQNKTLQSSQPTWTTLSSRIFFSFKTFKLFYRVILFLRDFKRCLSSKFPKICVAVSKNKTICLFI